MLERRRHQRVRCVEPPPLSIGFAGKAASGFAENLSQSGMMLRTALPLQIGHQLGLTLTYPWTDPLDVTATVASRIGELYGVRFHAGPMSRLQIDEMIHDALSRGVAAAASVHDLAGKKVLRIAGGLTAGLMPDLRHLLGQAGIDEIDASMVTRIDEAGLQLCHEAIRQQNIVLAQASEVFERGLQTLG